MMSSVMFRDLPADDAVLGAALQHQPAQRPRGTLADAPVGPSRIDAQRQSVRTTKRDRTQDT